MAPFSARTRPSASTNAGRGACSSACATRPRTASARSLCPSEAEGARPRLRVISFVTLLLGIAVGVRPVEVATDPAVAAVEFRLDGRLLTVLTAPPWKLLVDFGAPLPHDLVAVARNGEGAEIGRAVQRFNLPRSRAEATLTLLSGTGGRGRAARLVWASAVSENPERVELTMDGQALATNDL